MRKVIAIFLFLLILGINMTVCFGAEKKVRLTMTLWGDANYQKMAEEIVALHQKKFSNVEVEIMVIPFSEYSKKLSIMNAAGSSPDVAWLASEMTTVFMDSNNLLDISAIEKDKEFDINDISHATLSHVRKGKKLYGVSTNAAPGIIFFNKTLFKEKGLKTPLELAKEKKWTFEQMLSSAQAITDSSQGIFGVRLARDWKSWPDTLVDLFWAYGADILSKNNQKFALNSSKGAAALQYFSDLMFKHKVHPKPGEQTSFESGKVAMYRDKFGYVRKLANVKFDWDIAPLPLGPKSEAPIWVGASCYSVFKDSKNPKEAMELVKTITGKQGQIIATRLIPPSRKSVQQSDVFLKAQSLPTAEAIKISIIDKLSGPSRPFVTPQNWPLIEAGIQSGLDELFSEKADVKSVLQKMQKEVEPLLK